MKRIIAFLLALLCLCPAAIAAEVPYTGYYYDSWGQIAECPNIYTPEAEYFPVDMALATPLSSPSDLFVDEGNGLIYIADTGNSRVVVLDAQMQFVREITGFTENGEMMTFRNPEGVTLDSQGNLVVADTANGQVVRITQAGELLKRYTQPESALYPQDILFQPEKVACDLEDNIYALVPSVYQGVVLFDKAGEFLNFYGGNKVSVTPALLFDYYWKKLLSQEQAEKMARYVPINYLSMDMSKDGYMYVTLFSDTSKKQIRKLNPLGNDILRVEVEGKAKYGDLDILYHNGTRTDTQLADIAVSTDDFIYALDSNRGRVFVYSQGSDSLGVFGGSGRQTGLFSSACAIDTLGDSVYVLDSVRGSVTCFEPTTYGASVLSAMKLYQQGEYAASESIWRELLLRNYHLELAYDGIGKALLAEGKYQESLDYFKQANDVYWYSKAFQSYRVEAVREVIGPVLIGAAVLVILYMVWSKVIRKKGPKRERPQTPIRMALDTILHPIAGFEEIRYRKKYSAGFAIGILAAWFFLEIIAHQYTAFIFNGHKPDSINVLLILASTAALFFVLIFVNNALATFMDGESTLKQLWISCAYALMPMILLRAIGIVLGYALCSEESVFLIVLTIVAWGWTFWNIVCALQTMQQYTFPKTLANILLTVVGLVIVLFIGFLFFSLLQQVGSFVRTVFDELMLWQ